jgi:putative transcriptional regulator
MERMLYMLSDVRDLRRAKGISQEELGREVGVSRQTINAIEQDRYTPSLPLAIRLARFFGRNVEEIFHVD